MLYELRVNVFVEHLGDLGDVRDKLTDLKPFLRVINPDTEEQECSVIKVIENEHDHSPHGPCTVIDHWDNCP